MDSYIALYIADGFCHPLFFLYVNVYFNIVGWLRTA